MPHTYLVAALIAATMAMGSAAPAQDEGERDRPIMTPEVRAQSRYVWIEDALWIEPGAGGTLMLRYGQAGRLLETSPGALDRLPAPTAWSITDERSQPAPLEKQKDGFLIAGMNRGQPVQAEDSGVAIRNHGSKPGRKPVLYARWLPTRAPVTEPTLTLDILPVNATQFEVLFRDRPLANANLTLIAPDGTRTRLIADATGRVTVAAGGETGRFQLLCSFSENLPVHVNGEAFKGTRHVSTVTWTN